MIKKNESFVSFGLICCGCGMNYVVTAEDVLNSVDFICDQCGNLIDLIDVCGAALAEFSDDSLSEIWCVAQALKGEQCQTFDGTLFDELQ